MKGEAKLLCRLPPDVKGFLECQAEKFGSSMNSEVVRSIRERMERVQIMEMPAPAGE
ncbi:MAG: Arc family DNA-binding protein [Shinella sp.]|nr:Arc family DNA-binding protein [Shinella sp.]